MKKQLTDKERTAKAAKQVADSILPRRDFDAMITHDKTYFNAMEQELDYKLIKLDVLSN